jgi:serine protease Do
MLQELEVAATTVLEAASPSVVGLGWGWRRASGVVIAPGRVLTSAHAVRGQEATATFAGGRTDTATLTAVDVDGDLAVVRADTGEAPAIAWADDAPVPGRPVFALAAVDGGGVRVSFGIVSAVGRSFRGPRGRRITGAVEHTAAVARGSSGGPLVDAAGRLVGLSTVRLDGGLVLALPADAELRGRADALGRGEAPARRSLGVAVAPPRAARRMRRTVGLSERAGLLVRRVDDDGPAAGAGVRSGDLIVAAGGEEIGSIDALYAALDGLDAGAALTLSLVRGEEERQVDVVPEEV